MSAGGFFGYFRHPFAGEASLAVTKRLATEHNLLCLPGSAFGPEQDEFIRIAVASLERDELAALGRRLKDSVCRA